MRKLIRIIAAVTGGALGYCFGVVVYLLVESTYINKGNSSVLDTAQSVIPAVFCVILAITAVITVPFMIDRWHMINRRIENNIDRIPVAETTGGLAGLVAGLVVAYLLGGIFSSLRIVALGIALNILVYIICGAIGLYWGITLVQRLNSMRRMSSRVGGGRRRGGPADTMLAVPKIFDTSVLIDGRILDVMKTGFIEGNIVIPEYVLTELRHLSDSADPLKKNKGRRGLAILKDIQHYYGIEIYNTYSDKEWENVQEVDLKLLRLAQKLGGKVVTNDYNLIQVAEIQDIPVLNINDVVKALKPVVIPGETMNVSVIREGRENNQGVGYMEDGTMIVVEGGRRLIGQTVNTEVSSILQTASGRMIFVKPVK